MKTQIRIIQPLDVLMLRGNKSFGDSGEHAAASMPPNPSVLAGALRSFWLMQLGCDLQKFNNAQPEDFAEPIRSQLGTPKTPRGFRLAYSGLARLVNGHLERVLEQRLR